MNRIIYILVGVLFLFATDAMAQVDKRDVRRGNRDYKKENYKEAEIEYRKAIIKDSLSVAGNYNLAADLYRQNNSQEAQKVLDKIKEVAQASGNAADYFYNLGDVAIANQDWQTAVTAFEESLLRNPGDLDAKENYIYAKKKLEEQQQQQQNQQNDQNQDQQNQDGQNGQDDQQKGEGQPQESKISPQAAKQILQAMQAKERETQDKVEKKKAEALKSKQKEKNW